MHILLLGRDTSVTETIEQMLSSIEEWSVNKILSPDFNNVKQLLSDSKKSALDLIIANLADFPTPPKKIIQNVTAHFLKTPLLVLHHYSRTLLVKPLIEAGATGYLQLGLPEDHLHKAVENTSRGNAYIDTENT